MRKLYTMETFDSWSDRAGDIWRRLLYVMPPEAAEDWLNAPHEKLGGRSPAEAILVGKVRRVQRLVRRIEAG